MPPRNQSTGLTKVVGSITHLGEKDRGACVCAGSHGGIAVGNYALSHGFSALICHDAGIGMDDAGVRALELLGKHGVPAAAVDYRTARIGDCADMMARGTLSRANDLAVDLGLEPAMACADALSRLQERAMENELAHPADIEIAPFGRQPVQILPAQKSSSAVEVFALDSASRIAGTDTGQIIITGSHGGLPGGQKHNALKAKALLAAFNDAGVGIDDAGVSRLPALDEMGVAGVTVSCWSARIGEGRSTFETGSISHLNEHARELGAVAGAPLAELVDQIVRKLAKEKSE